MSNVCIITCYMQDVENEKHMRDEQLRLQRMDVIRRKKDKNSMKLASEIS